MPEVYDAHRFLHHYTDLPGLQGILESRTLWATHYKDLNDFSEVRHMREFLVGSAYPIVNRIMREDAKARSSYKRFLDKHGGLYACSRQQTRNIIDNLYRTTFEGGADDDIGAFAEPYVVSFCAHTDHDKYVKANGLLSMWRAYGDAGGFALVFDTKHLWYWLEPERQSAGYSAFYLGNVVYDDEKEKFEAEFDELVRTMEQFIHDRARREGMSEPGNMFEPFFKAVTRFKHRGFKEEREVRLTVAPLSGALDRALRQVASDDTEFPDKPIKPICSRERRGRQMHYIVLNDVQNRRPIPIVRIIVGPQIGQSERAREVAALAGDRIDVVCSECTDRVIA